MTWNSITYYAKAILEGIDFKIMIATMGSALLYAFGKPTAGVYAFIMICGIDFVMGICIALYNNEFTRQRFFRGVSKYVTFGIALIVARQIDIVIADVLDFIAHVSTHSILFQYRMLGILAVHEVLSVLGKLSGLGVPIPKGMLKKLNEYKEVLESREPEKIAKVEVKTESNTANTTEVKVEVQQPPQTPTM